MKIQNLELWKGATFNQQFRLWNHDETPQNLAGYTVTFKYGNLGDETPLFEKVAGLEENVVRVYITDEETNQWKPGVYFYVIETESAGGEIKYQVTGKLTVKSVANV